MSKLNTNAIRHLGSSVDNMTFDASGRVLMPNKPAASAYRSLTGTNSAGSYDIIYDAVQVNIGNHYNASTGRFTCPAYGLYRVSAFGMGTLISGSYNFYVRPKRNSSIIGATAYNYGDGNNYKHASGNWIVLCNAGDYLNIEAGGGAGYYGDGYAGVTFEFLG